MEPSSVVRASSCHPQIDAAAINMMCIHVLLNICSMSFKYCKMAKNMPKVQYLRYLYRLQTFHFRGFKFWRPCEEPIDESKPLGCPELRKNPRDSEGFPGSPHLFDYLLIALRTNHCTQSEEAQIPMAGQSS